MKHPQTAQMELCLGPGPVDGADVGFIHKSLCVAALPSRRPPDKDGLPTTSFARTGRGWSFDMTTANITIPDTSETIRIGVPYGIRARLLILWMASRAKLSSSRVLEIGPIREWLRDIGSANGGDAISQTKEQLFKLSKTNFSVLVKTSFGPNGGEFTSYNEQFIEGMQFAESNLYAFRDRNFRQMTWPSAIILEEKTWKRFRDESFPIPMFRLREIANSATAIDVFLYLSYRLPILEEEQIMTWRQYQAAFGIPGDDGKVTPAEIRRRAAPSITSARRAYPEAHIEDTSEGLLLRPSRPADSAFVSISMATPALLEQRKKLRKRFMVTPPAA